MGEAPDRAGRVSSGAVRPHLRSMSRWTGSSSPGALMPPLIHHTVHNRNGRFHIDSPNRFLAAPRRAVAGMRRQCGDRPRSPMRARRRSRLKAPAARSALRLKTRPHRADRDAKRATRGCARSRALRRRARRSDADCGSSRNARDSPGKTPPRRARLGNRSTNTAQSRLRAAMRRRDAPLQVPRLHPALRSRLKGAASQTAPGALFAKEAPLVVLALFANVE